MIILYTIIGALFILGVALTLLIWAWYMIKSIIDDRNADIFAHFMKGQLNKIDRWCSYEFPDIGYMCKKLLEAKDNKWRHIDLNSFREDLRKLKELKPLRTKEISGNCGDTMTKDKLTLILEQVALFRDYSTPEKGMDIATAREAILKLLLSEKEIAEIIAKSSLWNLGADSHQALSELVISIREQALKNML